MHATRTRGHDSPGRPGRRLPAQLLEQLDWIEETGAAHKAALTRLASATTEAERQEAAREEALAGEIHRLAISRLPLAT